MISKNAIIKYYPILNLPITAPYDIRTVAATKSPLIKCATFMLSLCQLFLKTHSQKCIQTIPNYILSAARIKLKDIEVHA